MNILAPVPKVKIEIIPIPSESAKTHEKFNSYDVTITFGELVFHFMGNLFSDRLSLRLAIQALCKALGEGDFIVIDKESPRFEGEQK